MASPQEDRTLNLPVQAVNDDAELFAPTGSETATATRSERVCSECGVRSYFLGGREPDWSGWRDGLCPSCAIREAAERVKTATREEQEQLVIETLRVRVQPLTQLVRETGVPYQVARAAKARALRDGLIQREKVPDKQERTLSRKEAGQRRQRNSAARDLELLRAHQPITARQFEKLAKVSESTAIRRLRKLLDAGLATREKLPANRRCVLYRAAAD